MSKEVQIYTDGACLGNPGKGGYASYLRYVEKSGFVHRKYITGGFRNTTNNRMELMAVIVGLEALKFNSTTVTIYSDSKYVVDSVIKRWVFGWLKQRDFGGKRNRDLWERFIKAYSLHNVTMQWVKGHAGIDGNEKCDQLANKAAESATEIDEIYEAGKA